MVLGLIAVNGYLSWTWGARDVPVLSVVALLAGSLIFGGPAAAPPAARTGTGCATRAGAAASCWCRCSRCCWPSRCGPPATPSCGASWRRRIEGQGAVRQVAVATNNTFYDALLLYLDDWPDRFDFTGGADFVDGSVAAVPSVLVGQQEPFVSPAVQLAQTYIDRNNGFPATAVGDWYVNFGFPGIVLGGLLSGLVVRAGQFAFRRFLRDPLVWGFSLVFMIRIFPGGVWATSAPKWVAMGLPIIAFTWLVNLFVRRARERRDDSPCTAAAGRSRTASARQRTASAR